MNGLLLEKLWGFSEIFLTCGTSAVIVVCCTHRELPNTRHLSAVSATEYSFYVCARLSKGALYGRFPPTPGFVVAVDMMF